MAVYSVAWAVAIPWWVAGLAMGAAIVVALAVVGIVLVVVRRQNRG